MELERVVEELKHRVEALEQAVNTLLRDVGRFEVRVEVPRVIVERRPVYVKVSEDELYGRIIMLAEEGFFSDYRSPSEVAHELHRRGWAPKDFQHVRPALEHLTVLGVFERVRDRRRRAYWVYKTVKNLEDIIQHK
ncbi:MAG: hypothetical protein QXD32_02070 [Nitrososphaerota archaeon]